MQVLSSSTEFGAAREQRPAVALGNFDGVHIGHQAIIRAARSDASARSAASVVFTFEPHPGAVVGRGAPPRLTTLEEKQRYIAALNVDFLVIEPFTREYAKQTPRAFATEILVGRLGVGSCFVGGDFGFGKERTGSVAVLSELGTELGFETAAAEAVLVDNVRVSSSQIRALITAGDVAGAKRRLTRPYALGGSVVSGDQRGKKLGIATANLKPDKRLLPAQGVYATRVLVAGTPHPAVTNVGVRPTFGAGEITIEAHILDFDQDLYESHIEILFEDRIREERRFGSRDDLVKQIKKDIEVARSLLNE